MSRQKKSLDLFQNEFMTEFDFVLIIAHFLVFLCHKGNNKRVSNNRNIYIYINTKLRAYFSFHCMIALIKMLKPSREWISCSENKHDEVRLTSVKI